MLEVTFNDKRPKQQCLLNYYINYFLKNRFYSFGIQFVKIFFSPFLYFEGIWVLVGVVPGPDFTFFP
jgi:hypothetical protein